VGLQLRRRILDYYQGVINDYIAADRALFINPEFCLQINAATNAETNGTHWYADAVAVDFRDRNIFLCEMTFSSSLYSLIKRLTSWKEHWHLIPEILKRDAFLPEEWPIRPWIFVPEERVPKLLKGISALINDTEQPLPTPRITTMEMVQPWQYKTWNRNGENPKPQSIPEEMRS
jgi:hypothetical protein